ncbi:hypothetical protein BST61_g7671 [Cercospora zeina]
MIRHRQEFMPIPKDDPRVALVKTSFVIYEHVDLTKAEQFLLDFGLHVVQRSKDGNEIYFAGYGPDPFLYLARKASTPGESKFCGAAYLVESRDDLRKASRIPGASEIRLMEGMPGGGEMMTLHDPSGIPVHLVYGQTQKPIEEMKLQKLVINFEDEKPRKGRFHRFESGPAPVHKWGHYGVTYAAPVTYQIMFNWYTKHLALAPSDIILRGEEPVTTFFHIDRGEEYTDHHAFYFKPTKPGQKPDVSHSAFEVHDIDIQHLGHDYLTSKGYKLCWGVGRHKLGSQVFDYWFDTSGFMLEHYADGDLVNKNTPVAHEQSGPTTLSMWGPPVPEEF